MGRIGLEIGAHIAGGSTGLLQIVNKSQLRKLGYSKFRDYSDELERDHPVQSTSASKPQIESGSFPLTDPSQAQKLVAVYHVRKRYDQLPI